MERFTALLERVDEAVKPVVALLCVYESVAIWTGSLPTISSVCWWSRGKHPLGNIPPALLVSWLALHLFRKGSVAVIEYPKFD